MTDNSIVTLTDDALDVVRDVRNDEGDPETLGLWLEVTGVAGGDYAYDMYFSDMEEATPDDRVQRYGDLPIVIPAESVSRLQGARLDIEDGGLVLVNPNRPTFDAADVESVGDLTGPVAQALLELFETQINPAIAAHGGFVSLIAVEEETAFLRMGGGCQGCGMASATLGQGIEVAIREHVPEITRVVDVTDHASGDNPYYTESKK
jgi:Fe/S biogenesis protein NfuA